MLNFEKFSIQKSTGSALVASAEAKFSRRFNSRSELLVHFLCANGVKEKNGMNQDM